jgi:formiminoglutamate deiminase
VTTIPAHANCHSHVFHRALRGRELGGDTFWQWRDGMYAVAAVLDPDLLHDLAVGVYGEMRLAGIGAVGEFHYVHHGPDGRPYAEANAMGEALIAAAREIGIGMCLLDTAYLAAGFDRPAEGVQVRFDDGSADRWAARVEDLRSRHPADESLVVGAAIHSVRAVPRDQLATVATAFPDAPLHVHVSEQPAENAACLEATGMTPVALLAEAGAWTPRTTAVHATHLTADDVAILGAERCFACFCPTTEAELADGIGPSRQLRAAGARLTLGTDSNTVIDILAEARALEMHERLASGHRGTWSAHELMAAAGETGHASLGLPPSAPVRLCDDSPRLAGVTSPLWAATAADVVVPDLDPGDVAASLRRSIDEIWRRV